MVWFLIFIPFAFGICALLARRSSAQKYLLFTGALSHLILTIIVWRKPVAPSLWGWLDVDPAGLLFLTITSLLFFLVSIYQLGYFEDSESDADEDVDIIILSGIQMKSLFIGCQLFFLSAMTLVTLSQHLTLMWVAIEATTLTSAPLIFFHSNPRSLEATWKYIIICSVGIALALLGNFFLSIASIQADGKYLHLVFNNLIASADRINPQWLKAAFILIVVGYGTKMGLAPMHTWLPDAHSESPSPISALLSGALLNCAFLGVFRLYQICHRAGLESFSNDIMLVLGITSLAVAAIFILGQSDYKRLLAYSSVEHMGLLALGLGFGGAGIFGSMLHALNHSVTKAALFLISGILLINYRSKKVSDVKGIFTRSQLLGLLWLLGFLSISGSPPFGLFMSEIMIIKSGFDRGQFILASLSLGLLVIVFIGMATVCLNMVQSQGGENSKSATQIKLKPTMIYPPALLLIISLSLGVYIPNWMKELLSNIAK
jgi:hydrogenase-4 component F